jgi:lipoate synthase
MALRYVVITSVDRDDLRDGGNWPWTKAPCRDLSPALRLRIRNIR